MFVSLVRTSRMRNFFPSVSGFFVTVCTTCRKMCVIVCVDD